MNRSILRILAGILIPVLISCAGAPPVPEVEESEPRAAAVETPAEPVWKIAGETVGSPDGIIDKEIGYTYDSNGRLQEISEQDGRGELLYLRRYGYRNGLLTEVSMEDRNGPVGVTVYEHSPEGRVVSETRLNAEGEVLSKVTYAYENGHIARTVAADGSGIPQLTAVYSYEGDLVAGVTYLLPGGSEEARFERVFESGRAVLEQTLGPDGSVENGKRLEYDGDMVAGEEYFTGSSVTKRVRFDYDSNGNIIRETWTNRGGRDYEVVERRWIQVTEQE